MESTNTHTYAWMSVYAYAYLCETRAAAAIPSIELSRARSKNNKSIQNAKYVTRPSDFDNQIPQRALHIYVFFLSTLRFHHTIGSNHRCFSSFSPALALLSQLILIGFFCLYSIFNLQHIVFQMDRRMDGHTLTHLGRLTCLYISNAAYIICYCGSILMTFLEIKPHVQPSLPLNHGPNASIVHLCMQYMPMNSFANTIYLLWKSIRRQFGCYRCWCCGCNFCC